MLGSLSAWDVVDMGYRIHRGCSYRACVYRPLGPSGRAGVVCCDCNRRLLRLLGPLRRPWLAQGCFNLGRFARLMKADLNEPDLPHMKTGVGWRFSYRN